MATIGDILENPVTGERVIIKETAERTNGELCTGELFVKAHGFAGGGADHTHPKQEETFVVTKGIMRFRINGKEADAQVGECIVIPMGALHSWWNATDEEASALVSFRPALNSETLFETMFGLARDGKTDKQGRPNLLQAAILFSAFKDEIQFSAPLPARILLTLLRPLAQLLGYRASYPQYTKNPVPTFARKAVTHA